MTRKSPALPPAARAASTRPAIASTPTIATSGRARTSQPSPQPRSTPVRGAQERTAATIAASVTSARLAISLPRTAATHGSLLRDQDSTMFSSRQHAHGRSCPSLSRTSTGPQFQLVELRPDLLALAHGDHDQLRRIEVALGRRLHVAPR